MPIDKIRVWRLKTNRGMNRGFSVEDTFLVRTEINRVLIHQFALLAYPAEVPENKFQ